MRKVIVFLRLIAVCTIFIFGTGLASFAQLEQRQLALPVVRRGDPCPVAKGSHDSVPPAPYIFCSSCLWFGKGPVYFAWSFRVNDAENAMFSLFSVPHEGSVYAAKTPWVSKPDYSGPILIRGQRLDGKAKLRFSVAGTKPVADEKLNAPNSADRTKWSFWPSSMFVPGPGCYGIQIDTTLGTDIVIFSVATDK